MDGARSYEKGLVVACNSFLCKEAWNKLVLTCILCKKNRNICKSVVTKLLRTMMISPVYSVLWMSRPGWGTFTHNRTQ